MERRVGEGGEEGRYYQSVFTTIFLCVIDKSVFTTTSLPHDHIMTYILYNVRPVLVDNLIKGVHFPCIGQFV